MVAGLKNQEVVIHDVDRRAVIAGTLLETDDAMENALHLQVAAMPRRVCR